MFEPMYMLTSLWWERVYRQDRLLWLTGMPHGISSGHPINCLINTHNISLTRILVGRCGLHRDAADLPIGLQGLSD